MPENSFVWEMEQSLWGVDGFEGESAGLNLVEKEILDATIQSPDFGSLAYDTAMDILEEKEVQRDITVTPRMITGRQKSKRGG